ncbi:hypothetical protein [Bradyrhizobium sp.]|nr:hypothetical protein [Bradyrhizobium sp.]MBV9978929.1 hypothetical protein [Bradyrhizobium sp.]
MPTEKDDFGALHGDDLAMACTGVIDRDEVRGARICCEAVRLIAFR